MSTLFHLFHSDTSILAAVGYSIFGMIIVFAMLCVLMGVIHLMHFVLSRTQKTPQEAAVPAPEVPKVPAPGSAGAVQLYGVPEPTAAMLMAIVADELGKPLQELHFISIREVEETK